MFIAVVSRISLADRARMRSKKALQRCISLAKRMRAPKGRHRKKCAAKDKGKDEIICVYVLRFGRFQSQHHGRNRLRHF